MNSLPYKVYYSRGNHSCHRCCTMIQAGRQNTNLEMAIMIQSNEDDCQLPQFYHMKCFFKTCLPRTEAAFDGYANLRFADQLAIKVHLGTMEVDSDDDEKQPRLPDFAIEYSRGDYDECIGCQQNIKTKELRIMNVVYDTKHNTAFDGKANWYHVICFARTRSELGWLQGAESIPGFKRLSIQDKETVMNQIPLISRELHKPIEKRTNPKHIDHDKLIEIQNKEYYELYDNLANYVSVDDRYTILRANFQLTPQSSVDLLYHLTDIIMFGALSPCNKCNTGELIFANSDYKCMQISNWSNCGNNVKEPLRRPTIISSNLLAKYPFLKTNQPIRTRVLHSFRLVDENGQDLVYTPYEHPLFNMEFVLMGNLKKSNQEIEKIIRKMGGTVVSVIHSKLAAVISNRIEIERMGFQMKEAKRLKIQVVSEDFLTAINTTDPILFIISESICDWGGDPYARIPQKDLIRKDTEFYTKSLPEKVTYKWKDDRVPVDPDVGLEDVAHVYCQILNRRMVKFSVILGVVDIENNRNTYYRMQLLESTKCDSYWLFESWGRISTTIGSKKLTTCRRDEAIERFKFVYKEKTGNNFGNLRFLKRPGKFYHLDIEFSPNKQTLSNLIPSTLSMPVFQLMQMLFDLNKMESMMVSCHLDLKQMPLGKISAKQIRSAMTVLKDISRLISRNGSTYADLRDASNKFYTMVPHGFNIERPPIIDSIQTVHEKTEMLESLLNMELIYDFLDTNENSNKSKVNPLDACFHKLRANIESIDKMAVEFLEISNIVANTHGNTHNQYHLEVLEIFKINREGEDTRFQAYANLGNHQLLWHGSRLMNFVSIISNGLKIAPVEAPVTGYMFGKGIYFADCVSKAANYCRATRDNNIGLMLLCEVALGVSSDLYFANSNVSGIPNPTYQSIRGCGKTFPLEYKQIDGVWCASGNLCQAQFQTGLHYNEFIVYDPSQVKIKFLVLMKFHFN
ncbi:poly [ADP-ribose] polymerase-like [Contarinia nasturtii]|uniref:poly [ADP-ribose] polymerase-like n=1 Tax=Contarinia nasturtii TaxID=265458 RepID=UPI0012D3973C|nr:poly [ADP-ribose] polymerase-like [Contarinia nasturtii]